jgi:hypothetical protein
LDLDNERFSCNNCEFVKLDQLTQDWIEIDCECVFFGDWASAKQEIHQSVTMPASLRVQLPNNPSLAYEELNVQEIAPQSFQHLPDSVKHRPAVILAQDTLDMFLKQRRLAVSEARD